MHRVKCQQCGAEFEARRSDVRYCSEHCRDIYWRTHRGVTGRHLDPRKCGYCGKVFVPRNIAQRFCSHGCANQFKWDARKAEASIRNFDADGRHRKWREAQMRRDPDHFSLLPPPGVFA